MKDIILEKKFKKDDIIVVTSGRSGTSMCIARGLWTAKFDRDITYNEAVQIHYENMKKEFPGMFKNLTIEKMKNILKPEEKYFLNDRGEVQTYSNHEVADEFDKLYFSNKFELSELSRLKDKYVREHNIKATKYEGDKWSEFRIFDDITDWINEQLNKP